MTKKLNRLLSILLSAGMFLCSAFVLETTTGLRLMSVEASAEEVIDCWIGCNGTLTLNGTESQEFTFDYGGQGIAGLTFNSTGGINISYKNSEWHAYPQVCKLTLDVWSATGSGAGTIALILLDDNDSEILRKVVNVSVDNSYSTDDDDIVVIDPDAPEASITFNNMYFPTPIEKGTGQHISGTISSTEKISSITAIVKDASRSSGPIVFNECVYPDSKTYVLDYSELDYALKFGNLDAGHYTLTYVVTSGSSTEEYTHRFRIAEPEPVFTFSDMYFPSSFTKGNGQHISGVISSTYNISLINAKIRDSSGSIVLEKYVLPNSKRYDLGYSDLDYALSFGSLNAGSYTLTYEVTSSYYSKEYTHSFNVVDSAPTISFNDMYFPSSIKKGNGQHISGTVKSTAKISKITATVYNSKNEAVLSSSDTPNSKSYTLKDSRIDDNLTFGKLSAGSYKLTYKVTSDSSAKEYSHSFSVTDSAPTISFGDMYFPSSIKKGNGQHISGTVKSTAKISKITATVYNSKNEAVLSASDTPNSKSYTLKDSRIDDNLTFGKLSAGTYTLTYKVTSGSSAKKYSHSFSVKGTSSTVSFSDMYFPSSIKKGNGQHLSGTIKSSSKIDKITATVYDSNNKSVLTKSVTPNAKTYTLNGSTLDERMKFGTLDVGSYTLKYTVVSGSTTETSKGYAFKVEKEKQQETSIDAKDYGTNKTGIHLSLSKSRAYADKHWNKKNYNKNYYDYSSDNTDCANFVSQILVAGGMPMDDVFWGNKKALSPVFRGFDRLKVYLFENYGVKTIMKKKYIDYCEIEDCGYPKGTRDRVVKTVSNLKIGDIKPGDLVITNNDGHIMFVNKVKNGTVYVYGHTNDRDGNWPVDISGINGVIKTSILYD